MLTTLASVVAGAVLGDPQPGPADASRKGDRGNLCMLPAVLQVMFVGIGLFYRSLDQ